MDVSSSCRAVLQTVLLYCVPQREGSDQYRVRLGRLTQQTTGRYRCEVCIMVSLLHCSELQVSEEGPTFATDSTFTDLLVVVVPPAGPCITGSRLRHPNTKTQVSNLTTKTDLLDFDVDIGKKNKSATKTRNKCLFTFSQVF